jgi:outer membrane protein assembly factor BamB
VRIRKSLIPISNKFSITMGALNKISLSLGLIFISFLPAAEGDILWQQPVAESVESTPAVDDSGNVYCAGGESVYSYRPDGTHRWTNPIGPGTGEFNSPALSPDQSIVYGGGGNFIYAIEAATGTTKWKTPEFPTGFHSVPALSLDASRLYLGVGSEHDQGNAFYSINTSDGSVAWEYVMPHEPRGYLGYLGGAITGPDGNIYISSQMGWLVSLTDNGDSYTENWAYDVGAEMRMPPSMDAEGYLYVGSSSAGGFVHKVDSRTGTSAGGNWPVQTTAGEIFANIAIGDNGTIYINSEDQRLWAFNPDGSVKWNNLEFEVWGSDPLVRADGRIIVGSELDGAARVACILDDGDSAVLEWTSDPIATTLLLNETNVNIAPNGTIYITSGQPEFMLGQNVEVYAIEGNGQGLSSNSYWPKYMKNIQNNGIVQPDTIPTFSNRETFTSGPNQGRRFAVFANLPSPGSVLVKLYGFKEEVTITVSDINGSQFHQKKVAVNNHVRVQIHWNEAGSGIYIFHVSATNFLGSKIILHSAVKPN